jgi:hypothetical protein
VAPGDAASIFSRVSQRRKYFGPGALRVVSISPPQKLFEIVNRVGHETGGDEIADVLPNLLKVDVGMVIQ